MTFSIRKSSKLTLLANGAQTTRTVKNNVPSRSMTLTTGISRLTLFRVHQTVFTCFHDIYFFKKETQIIDIKQRKRSLPPTMNGTLGVAKGRMALGRLSHRNGR
ncbi:hypothetical protein HNY73_012725 [Argiope bruennichi]|uniref:Uncharacterized protein n=1 Tax=Argiope bruennichi TaxID=94029 RepID=A0A8T0F0C8_ARGBR|nr:hypothetical protein HNY73_012725 [Argiope bruennichi]